MTNYVEQQLSPNPLNETFGPAVNPVVGDTWTGSLGQRGEISFDVTDAFSINVVAGEEYFFTGYFTNSDRQPLSIRTLTDDGIIAATSAPEADTVTFSFTATQTGEQVISIKSLGFSISYTVALDTIVPSGATNGDDVLLGGDAPTTLELLDGNDTWTGVSDPTSFVVGQYIDSIYGGAGDDSIFGGIGNDALDGGQDNDLVDAGDGNDNVWGGDGDDDIYGGSGRDRLNGNSGDDDIFGGSGSDIIRGGKGEDYIEGGDQSDEIYAGAQSDEVYGGNGNDLILGEEGADLLFGGYGNDTIDGGSFDDVIYGDHGRDKLNGGSGDDIVYGGKSDDKLNGNSGDDQLFGGRGNDVITGGTGDDVLDGGRQGDRLFGGDGNDILHGGIGNDELTGGADADTFVFAGSVNDDVITDFEVGVDKIDVSSYGAISAGAALDAIAQVGADVLIDLKGDGTITLQNIAVEDLSFDDFIFAAADIFDVG